MNKIAWIATFSVFTGAVVLGTVKAMYGLRNWLDQNDPTELEEKDDS